MTVDRRAEISADETDAFLGAHETGVLSLAREGEPYAIPISYGYDASTRRLYLRLVPTPESERRRFLTSEPDARLVVHDDEGDTHRSAVATGTLVRVDPESVAGRRIAISRETYPDYTESKSASSTLVVQTGQPLSSIASRIEALTPISRSHPGQTKR